MAIKVLLRDHPSRTIALATSSHALIFRHTGASQSSRFASASSSRTSLDSNAPPKCIVEFESLENVDLSEFRSLSHQPVFGTLGLITLEGETFISVVTACTKAAQVRPGETVEQINAVRFFCLSSSRFDMFGHDNYADIDPYEMRTDYSHSHSQAMGQRDQPLEHPCADMHKMLSDGSFYYSTDFDLTNRLQDRSPEATDFDIDNLDGSFLWNSYMIAPLVRFRGHLLDHERAELDRSRMLTSVIRGFVKTMTVPNAAAPLVRPQDRTAATLTIFSRLSCRRAGTRFNSRGIDDDGNVANFVETETIYWSPAGICFSYAQVRGSVPTFWEQQAGLLPGKQNISLTRSKEGTQPAFDRHFEDLEKEYGSVHVVNLLSDSKPGEVELTQRYTYGVKHCSINGRSEEHKLLNQTNYDFHAETKGAGGFESANYILRLIGVEADIFQYYMSEELEDRDEDFESEKPRRRPVVVLEQNGVFRTNCLDCLDRTNLIQTMISRQALETFVGAKGQRAAPDFYARHGTLWADNGDALSKIYAGTGALKSSFTRSGKMSIAGAIADARKSAQRLYINNFTDKGRQNTIDLLLGRLMGQQQVLLHDPISDYVNQKLSEKIKEYSKEEMATIWVGTYNVNGRSHGKDADLRPWLFPGGDFGQQPDMYVVGFQEIVDLSPQQIMNSDPSRLREWEYLVKRHLNEHMASLGSDDKYVRLRSGQLVGAALCVYVKSSKMHLVKHVEGANKKTGLQGMAGNKGAVAIRMQYANTQICFVTAHLAAGFGNYDERNKDFKTIHEGLRFQRNRSIDDHDTVIWLGDFNYRIGLTHERCYALVKAGDLSTLYENDQLNIQMVAGLVFRHYAESKITFMPTYKFDVGTDTYDTSEKQRIPAWTDRILYKGKSENLRQTCYLSAREMRISDHKPVYATFECNVRIINEEQYNALSRALFEKRRAEAGGSGAANARRAIRAVTTARTAVDTDRDSSDFDEDEDLLGSIEPGLPPASSDRSRWWLANGQPARSTLQPPAMGMAPNPKRPSNPWAKSEEPDWVVISSLASGPENQMVMSERPHVEAARAVQQDRASTPARRAVGAGTGPGMRSGTNSVRRNLPPPFDPHGQVQPKIPARSSTIGNLEAQAANAARHAEEEFKPALPARSNTNLSTTSAGSSSSVNGGEKKKPPIARKPVHLATLPTRSPASEAGAGRGRAESLERNEVPPRSSSARNGGGEVFPPPPRRSTGAVTHGHSSSMGAGMDGSTARPAPPAARRGGAAAQKQSQTQVEEDRRPKQPPRPPVDLLGDDEGGGLKYDVLRPE